MFGLQCMKPFQFRPLALTCMSPILPKREGKAGSACLPYLLCNHVIIGRTKSHTAAPFPDQALFPCGTKLLLAAERRVRNVGVGLGW